MYIFVMKSGVCRTLISYWAVERERGSIDYAHGAGRFSSNIGAYSPLSAQMQLGGFTSNHRVADIRLTWILLPYAMPVRTGENGHSSRDSPETDIFNPIPRINILSDMTEMCSMFHLGQLTQLVSLIAHNYSRLICLDVGREGRRRRRQRQA